MAEGKILYISYDGMTDPLGGSQVLPYLGGLVASGHRIVLLSFEKPERTEAEIETVAAFCRAHGIEWVRKPYRRKPPVLSSMLDLRVMKREARRLHAEHRFDIVHCRSYLPAMAGLALKRAQGVKMIFDMRGFWADERVEGGLWNLRNPLFRAIYAFFKRRERDLLAEADQIVSLTEAGKRVLLARPDRAPDGPPITVIPCCVDFESFPLRTAESAAAGRAALGIEAGRKVVLYLGSVGTWYLLDEMLDLFRVYRRRHPDALFLFVTRDDPAPILAAARSRGIDDALMIRPALRAEVPVFASAGDMGLFFIKPCFSKTASSPTKMGELLALGIPVLTNGEVGDVRGIAEASGAGVLVEGFDDAAYGRAIEAFDALDFDPASTRERARPWFDLDMGVERYDAIYRSLLAWARRNASTINGSCEASE